MLVRDREQWDVIAIPMAAPLDAMWNTLSAVYEELDPATTKDFAFRIFNMHAVVATRFRFFQRRQPAVTDQPGVWQPTVLQAGLQQALPNAVFENIHGSPDEFLLCLPYTADGLSLPLNEMIACYAIMFFLSSLVRYHPDYIDTIAESSVEGVLEQLAICAFSLADTLDLDEHLWPSRGMAEREIHPPGLDGKLGRYNLRIENWPAKCLEEP